MSDNLVITQIDTPVGPITISETPIGVRGVYFGEFTNLKNNIFRSVEYTYTLPENLASAIQLMEYFSGYRKAFSLPFDFNSLNTTFQKKVWQALGTIPYGQTHSYKDIAMKINCPNGYRAVGQANGANPIPIIIPCHRVLAANYYLGGYSSGLNIKKALLEMEGCYYRERNLI